MYQRFVIYKVLPVGVICCQAIDTLFEPVQGVLLYLSLKVLVLLGSTSVLLSLLLLLFQLHSNFLEELSFVVGLRVILHKLRVLLAERIHRLVEVLR